MVIAHADWSVDARKRWLAVGTRATDGWKLAAPAPVGPPETLLDRLRALADGGAVALGVDLPLGLPRAYAIRHGRAVDFPDFLRSLRDRPDFFRVCATLGDLSPDRPFYPARGERGMTRAAHAAALGLDGPNHLSRACDRATPERPAGAPLFWTLGANQTGKAAIAAWRDWLLPALASPNPPRLWPFEGDFKQLLTPGRVAVAETYPAEALRHLGLKLVGSKRRQGDRALLSRQVRGAMQCLLVQPDPALSAMLDEGFGSDAFGEDRFDCVIGVLAVLNVLVGNRPDSTPPDPWLRRWEGWVLGQTALPRAIPVA